MDQLAEVIRTLMDRRNLTGARLAQDIGLSATSISKIVTGQTKPRQVTFSRLIRRLCLNPEEEQMMVRAFTGLPDTMPEVPDAPLRPIPGDEIERVTRYLEVKSMAVAFESDVESVLSATGLSYQKDYRKDPYICDFLIELPGRQIAVDCKYNVNRDWDRTHATVKLLLEKLPCDEVVIAVPYENELARQSRPEIEEAGGRIVSLENLKEAFS